MSAEERFSEKIMILVLVFFVLFGGTLVMKAPKSTKVSATSNLNTGHSSGFFGSSHSGHGYYSSSKAGMQNLKTALVNYNCDLGFFPFIGTSPNERNYSLAEHYCLGLKEGNNVLVATGVGMPFEMGGKSPETYNKRWKGPYMDCDPSEFMVDAWGNKIKYLYFNNCLWLHSSGEDGYFDTITDVTNPIYEGNDVIMAVSRLKYTKFGDF